MTMMTIDLVYINKSDKEEKYDDKNTNKMECVAYLKIIAINVSIKKNESIRIPKERIKT